MDAWKDERIYLNLCQFFAKTLYYQGFQTLYFVHDRLGDLSYFESINKETLKNAQARLLDLGIILMHKGTLPPSASKTSVSNDKSKNVTWIAVHPDYIPKEPLPSLSVSGNENLPTKENTTSNTESPRAPGLENELNDTMSAWYFHKPTGKLWDFCDRVGKFRREGKNRRDTATVSSRVLRLARMTSLWTFDEKGAKEPVFAKL